MSPDSLPGSPCSWSTSEPESHEEITSFVTGYKPPAKWRRISFDSPSVSVISLPSCEWSDDVSTPDFSKEITKARRSPRVSKKKRLTDFYTEDTSSCHYPREGEHASVTVSDNWCLFGILELNGCREACAVSVHGLSKYDILSAHSNFISKTCIQQRYWIFDYFISHCPNNEQGIKDLKTCRTF